MFRIKKKYDQIYTSIDVLPVYNWFQINKSGDLSYLFVDRNKKNNPHAEKVFNEMYADYFNRFGMTKEFREHLKNIKKLSLLICQNAIKFDSAKAVNIEIMEMEMEKIAEQKEFDLFESVAALNQRGFKIDVHVTSIAEYSAIINLVKKQNNAGKKGT